MKMHDARTSSQTVTAAGADNTQMITKSIILHRQASEIEMKHIDWLWKYRIARGKLTMISGNPGLGKSQVIAYMAYVITTNGKFADETDCNGGDVIILSAEDDAADTIVPRLNAAGANLEYVNIIDSVNKNNRDGNTCEYQFDLTKDIPALENLLSKLGNVAAIFIDPISAYTGDIDDHRNGQVRKILGPLARLAEIYNVAIICVSHHNKSGSPEALMRVIGSIGFVAAARAAFAIIKNPTDENMRYLLPLKNNIGNDKTGLMFSIESHKLSNGIETSRVAWSKEIVNTTADEILRLQSNPPKKTARAEVKGFIEEALKNGAKLSTQITQEIEDAGYSLRTAERAKEELGIVAKKDGPNGEWRWHMPNAQQQAPQDRQECH